MLSGALVRRLAEVEIKGNAQHDIIERNTIITARITRACG